MYAGVSTADVERLRGRTVSTEIFHPNFVKGIQTALVFGMAFSPHLRKEPNMANLLCRGLKMRALSVQS